MSSNVGNKILGAVLLIGGVTGLVLWVKQQQAAALAATVNDATNVGMPYSIDLTQLVMNPVPKGGVPTATPIISAATQQALANTSTQQSITPPVAVTSKQMMNAAGVNNGVIQTGTYQNYPVQLMSDGYYLAIPPVADPTVMANAFAVYSTTDGSFMYLRNDATSVNMPYSIDITKVVANPNYNNSTSPGVTYPFSYAYNGVNVDVEIDTVTKDIILVSNEVVNYDQENPSVIDSYSDTDCYYSPVDGSFIKLVYNYGGNEENPILTLSNYPATIDITSLTANSDGVTFSSPSIDPTVFKITADGSGGYYLTYIIQNDTGVNDPTSILFVDYSGIDGTPLSYTSGDGSLSKAPAANSAADTFYNTTNAASADGMPFVLDLTLIKYDSDPMLLPAGSYPTGVYNGQYKVYGSPTGNLTLDGVDPKGNYFGDYTYDATGKFLNKAVNP